MSKIEIAKAKVDWWKTWCTTTIILSVTSFIAYWQTKLLSEDAALGFARGGFVFLIIYFLCAIFYYLRHRQLIDECK